VTGGHQEEAGKGATAGEETHSDHPGESCDEAHPAMSHDEFLALGS